MVVNDVILNKIQIIERCIKRIIEEYANNPSNLRNYTKQDAIILNLQRACQACIDLAMHIISEQKMGLPQSSRDGFRILEQENIISKALAANLKAMVGFRNIAVHDYQNINLDILQKIIEYHLGDIEKFKNVIMEKLSLK